MFMRDKSNNTGWTTVEEKAAWVADLLKPFRYEAMKDMPVEQMEKALEVFFNNEDVEEFMNAVHAATRTYIDDLEKRGNEE